MNQPGDPPLPDWAQQARRVTRAAIKVASTCVLVSWLLAGVDLVVDGSLRGRWATWAFGIGFGSAAAVVLVAGVVWLAGETVAGTRSRQTRRKSSRND
ncbi:hypothetical protein [Aeromicrobium endophyticum]|uniref:Uncharacterized protein n=1 Tax=Aeromicrobium endophyticum TaxID=2292704 RepID=A0A371P3J4_9ACTN|nr:hypothetical protein [Aeromicrobium endophyticum]REK69976.1 hypothetical protein DX116_12380 [Aeromicrobium endophyticum]